MLDVDYGCSWCVHSIKRADILMGCIKGDKKQVPSSTKLDCVSQANAQFFRVRCDFKHLKKKKNHRKEIYTHICNFHIFRG